MQMPPKLRANRRQLIADLQALQSRAHSLTMHKTAKAINEAMNCAGWEFASLEEDLAKDVR